MWRGGGLVFEERYEHVQHEGLDVAALGKEL